MADPRRIGDTVSKINGASAYDMNSKCGKISDFGDKAFKVGNGSAYGQITDKFITAMQKANKEIDKFLEAAAECLEEINECISIDNDARTAAQQAYDTVMADKSGYTTEVYVPSSNGYRYEYDEASHKSAAQAKYDEVWRKENSWPWED